MYLNNIGNKLKQLRLEYGFEQEYIAKAVGMSLISIKRIESGVARPGLDKLVTFADFYGVSVDWLLGRTYNREINS